MTSEGDTLAGRYVLVRPLGRGGMAEVWEAQDETLRRRVALKLFFVTGDEADAQRAVAEMHTLAGLSHPNLVTVHDAGRDGDRTFLVLELVTGATLADHLAGPGLDPATVATVGAQVAAGLAYIHGRGIVHRDVKPANVLLPVRDHVDAPLATLADFGIAQHAGQDRLTQAGMTIGTAQYLAPEQVTGRPVGPPADVYALGLVLLEALGHRPAWAGTPVEIALARLTQPPVVPAGLPPAWARALTAMTATDPEARPSAADVRAVFAAPVAPAADTGSDRTAVLAATEPVPPPPPRTALLPVIARDARSRRGRRGVLAGGVVLLAGAIAAVIVVVTSTGSAERSTPPAATPAVTAPVVASTPVSATSSPATSAPASTPTVPPTTAAPPASDPPGPPDRTPPGQTKSKGKGKPGG